MTDTNTQTQEVLDFWFGDGLLRDWPATERPRERLLREGRISIGISVLRDGLSDIEGVLKRADQALYFCKQNGRNCVNTLPA